jgi:hypothetical protein
LNICPISAAFEPAFVSHFVALELAARERRGRSGAEISTPLNFVRL